MKRPTLRVLEYRHSQTHPWYLDLRPFNRGRKFFKTKAEAEAERLRQITTLERHGREAIGLPAGELSAIVEARKKLARHGKTIEDAATLLPGLPGANPQVQRHCRGVGERSVGSEAQGWDERDVHCRSEKASGAFQHRLWGTPDRRYHCRRNRQLVA